MTVLAESNRVYLKLSQLDRQKQSSERPVSKRWARWLLLALAAGYLLFCHGCHADEDVELLLDSEARDSLVGG